MRQCLCSQEYQMKSNVELLAVNKNCLNGCGNEEQELN